MRELGGREVVFSVLAGLLLTLAVVGDQTPDQDRLPDVPQAQDKGEYRTRHPFSFINAGPFRDDSGHGGEAIGNLWWMMEAGSRREGECEDKTENEEGFWQAECC